MNKSILALIVLSILACKTRRNAHLTIPNTTYVYLNAEIANSKSQNLVPDHLIRDTVAVVPNKSLKTNSIKIKHKNHLAIIDTLPKENRKTDRLSMASGISFYSGMLLAGIGNILGVSFIFLSVVTGLLAISGVVLAIMALKNRKKHIGKFKGYGWAISVLIIFGLLVFSGLMSAIALSGLLA